MSDGKINSIFKEIRENDIGYLWEHWCGETYNLFILGGNTSKIDGVHKTKGLICTCKFRYDPRKKAKIQWDFEKEINPEYTMALKMNCPFYILQCYPQWNNNQIKIIKVNPKELTTIIRQKDSSIDLENEPINQPIVEILNNEGIRGIETLS